MTLNCYPDVDNLLFDMPLKQVLSLPCDILALNAELSVEVLNLSFRPAKRLSKGAILTLHQLLALSPEDLYEMPGIGRNSVEEIVQQLCQFFSKVKKTGASHSVIVGCQVNSTGAANKHVWMPFTFRDDWDVFSNGDTAPTLPVTLLALSSELTEALSIAQCEQITELLDWTWERAQQELGENAAEEISDALITFVQIVRNNRDAGMLSPSLSSENRQKTLEARWTHCLLGGCGFQKRTRTLLAAAEIMTMGQLLCVLDPLCSALCFDFPAFEDIWNRLVALGLRQGDALSVWDHLVKPERCEIRLEAVAAEIHRALSEKQWKVLDLRYGLQLNAKDDVGERLRHTLEEISRLSYITRERARQIELAALKKLEVPGPTSWHSLAATLCTFMDLAGGVMSVKDAARVLTAHIPAIGIHPEALCDLLFEISDEFIPIHRHSIYCRSSFPASDYPLVINRTAKMVKSSIVALSTEEMSRHVHDLLTTEDHPVEFAVVAACIRADGRFTADLQRKDLNFHLVQILRQIGYPTHFTEIAAKLNASGWRPNLTTEKSVATRLAGERDLFVYVAAGTYGLAEWGSEDKRVFDRGKNGQIKDIIEEFLTERDAPAHISEIVAFVLSRKRCQDFSVLQRLSNDDRFHAFERGKYGLRKWVM